MDFGVLAGAVLAPYLPSQSPVLNNMIGLSVGKLGDMVVRGFWTRYGKSLQATPLWNPARILIRPENPLYAKLETYLIEKYRPYLHSCDLVPRNGEVALSLHQALFSRRLWDEYEDHPIEWTVDERTLSVQSRTASAEILRRYLLEVSNFKSSSLKMTIFKAFVESGSAKKIVGRAYWEEMHVFSNKRVSNTIMADNEVFQDIGWFLDNEAWYNQRGIPYKRGYVLYGPPGTGKTSALKAIANEHGLDIYTLDLSAIESNTQLSTLMGDIQMKEHDRPYLLIMEDLDHCDLFAPHRVRQWKGALSVSCFLNELDGVAETAGRILVFTTNSLEMLEKCYFRAALMRPGRIDKKILIGYCTEEQYVAIVEQQYDAPFPDNVLVPPLDRLSPAALIGIIQRFPDDMEGFLTHTETDEFCDEVKKIEQALSVASTGRRKTPQTIVQRRTARVWRQKRDIRIIEKKYQALGTKRKHLKTLETELETARAAAKKRAAAARKKRKKSAARPT